MRRRWMGAMVLTLLGANGLFAQDTPPANAGPFQAKPEAKGKKAVPSRGGESDQDKPAFPLEEPAKGGNPMFTLAQFRKPKPPMAEPPAGEKAPATVPAKDELKNHAMMGLGFNTHHGIHMNVEVRKEDVRRTCTMILPNLFFQIPARSPESEKKDISTPIPPNQARLPVRFLPMSQFISSVEDRIDLSQTQYLGLVEVEKIGR